MSAQIEPLESHTVHQEIHTFLQSLIPAVGEELDYSANLLELEIVDSVAMMEIVVWLESNYQITIDTDDLVPENFSSVDAMVNYLGR